MSKRTKVFKRLLMIIVLALCIGLIVYLFPVIRNLSTPEGQMEFKNHVANLGLDIWLYLDCNLHKYF